MPRGRKPNVPGVTRGSAAIPSVRMPDDIMQRYSTAAMVRGLSVARVAREVLIANAPKARALCGARCHEETAWVCWRDAGHGGRHESSTGGDWFDEEHAPKGARSEEPSQ